MGHTAKAVDLPGDDESAGLSRYTELVVEAIDGADDVALVAQSLGGFTAAMACARAPIASLTLVNAMIPAPGETAGEWWANTGAVEARSQAAAVGGYGDFDVVTYFLHDVDPDVAAAGAPYQRAEADAVFASPCEFATWPSIPIRVLAGADDRFFPMAFQQHVAHERLGLDADVLPGGHLIAVANPTAVADYLVS
jgi:pimeloyl-ACP methyl ester carboxylesterase